MIRIAWLLALVLICGPPHDASGDCLVSPEYAQTIRIKSCQPALEVALNQIDRTGATKSHLKELFEGTPSSVIEAEIVESSCIRWCSANNSNDALPGDIWSYFADGACSEFQASSALLISAHWPCCDIVPPDSRQCAVRRPLLQTRLVSGSESP